MLSKINLIAIIISCACFSARGQDIKIVSVRSSGHGSTQSLAVKDAILEAVAQVTGQRISSKATATEKSFESTKRGNEYEAEYARKVDSVIRGVVKNSSTLSVDFDTAAGQFKAVVDVGVATLVRSPQLARPKIAIVPGRSKFNYGPYENLIEGLTDGLTNIIVPSQKFAVLDRVENQAVKKEFLVASTSNAATEEAVRLQSTVSADFLLVINITDIRKIDTNVGDRITLKANIKILDYSTGQVRYSLSRGVTGILVGNQTEKLVGQRLGKVLGVEMMEYGFPSTVVGIDGKYLTIDAGNSKFQPGDKVRIFSRGPDLEDPNTGESLGGSQREVALGVVETTAERVSVVVAISGRSELENLQVSSIGGKLPKLIVRFDEVVLGNSSTVQPPSAPIGSAGDSKRHDNDW